jgi:hypothetical protein
MYRPYTSKLQLECSVKNMYCRVINKECEVPPGVLEIIRIFLTLVVSISHEEIWQYVTVLPRDLSTIGMVGGGV